MKRHQLTQIEANMRMGCAILRFYLKRENNDVRKALARYNGSVGRRKYPDLVVTRWTTSWNGADDLGLTAHASAMSHARRAKSWSCTTRAPAARRAWRARCAAAWNP